MEYCALQLNKVQFAGISILYQLSIRGELLYYPTSCPVQRQVLCRYVWYSTLIFTNSSFSIAVLSSIPQRVSCRSSLQPCQSQERMDVLLRRYVWQPAIEIDTLSNGRAVEIPCPTCPTCSHFIQDKFKISIYLSLDKCKICYKVNKILYEISYLD